MSDSPSPGFPYHITTTNDNTKIYKSPIAFNGQHFLTTATQWTKKRIFSRDSDSTSTNSVVDPSGGDGGSSGNDSSSGSGTNNGAAPSITFGPAGEIIVVYSSCVQLWTFDPNTSGGIFRFAGTTSEIGGDDCTKVISANLIPNTKTIIVQVKDNEGSFGLQVHQLNSSTIASTNSLERSLVLPPASSSANGSFYHIYCPSGSDYFAVVSENEGMITLFSVKDYHPLPLSGLETNMGADRSPLFDIKGRWLVLVPKQNKKDGKKLSTQTTVKLPPEGPLYERLVENLSSTAAASIRSLSEAGVAGIKTYLANKNNSTEKDEEEKEEINPNQKSIPLNKMLNNMFMTDSSNTPIQIVDIPTESTICHFTPLYGVSHLSLSPHDTTLATVTLNGDHIYTYDISYVPNEVGLTGRYVRGKLPAKVRRVIWDSYGGLGVTTWEKGSLHWFDKRRSFDSMNKVWKLSGWGIEDGQFISVGAKYDDGGNPNSFGDNASAKSMQLLLLKRCQVMISDVVDGKCTWKYDIPMKPIWAASAQVSSSPNVDSPILSSSGGESPPDTESLKIPSPPPAPSKAPTKEKKKNSKSNGSVKKTPPVTSNEKPQPLPSLSTAVADPLSFYEMEACLPYPYIHEDRRIVISVFEEQTGEAYKHYEHSDATDEAHKLNDHPNRVLVSYPIAQLFGRPLRTTVIDFGKPDGQAKFSPRLQGSPQDDDEIKSAMESMVIAPQPSLNVNANPVDSPATVVPQLGEEATLRSGSTSPPEMRLDNGADNEEDGTLINLDKD